MLDIELVFLAAVIRTLEEMCNLCMCWVTVFIVKLVVLCW